MSCSNWNLFMLLAISHVAVALFSYYCFSYNNRPDDQQLAEVSLQTTKLDAVVFDVGAPGSYDFFYFVLQWPGSYTPRKQDVPNNFTIHGLWPAYWTGEPLADCQGSNFSKAKIASLVANLKVQWPSIDSGKPANEEFWKHEWKKHGTCSEAVLDQFKYFKAALRLKGSLDILQTLQIKGVAPSAKKNYSTTDIIEILKKKYNEAPRIKCNKKDSNDQLLEIRFCVNRTGANLIDCKGKSPTNCGGKMKFPPIS